MAAAAARGAACEADTETRLLRAQAAGPDDLLRADGYIFASPENLAAMAGLMKDFFDRCYYPCLEALNGRPYACMVCAGSDGSNAARQMARIATGWRLRAVAPPLIILTHAQSRAEIEAPKTISDAALAPCAALGAAMAVGLAGGMM